MTEDQINQVRRGAVTGKLVWRGGDNRLLIVSGVKTLPAYEGDHDPEPSVTFRSEKGWCALSNCDPLDFFLIEPIFQ